LGRFPIHESADYAGRAFLDTKLNKEREKGGIGKGKKGNASSISSELRGGGEGTY